MRRERAIRLCGGYLWALTSRKQTLWAVTDRPYRRETSVYPLLEDRLRQHGMNTFRLIDKLGYV
jgi:hypothetical protein